MMVSSTSPSAVGALLREWRSARGKSQLSLALHAGVSARHLSFIETGRAKPSREMILLLSDALEVPLRARNTLLDAAGYAPMFKETALEAPEMHHVVRALEVIIRGHGNNPAIVVDRRCDILMSNDAARAFLAHLLPPESLALANNMVRLIFRPDGVRPFIENWREVASEIAHRILRESVALGDELPVEIAESGLELPTLTPRLTQEVQLRAPSVMLPIRFRRGDLRLNLFTTVTTLMTPLDVTGQELRVESLFPADEDTARELAAITSGSI
jgi:transcriptional regulator with XRE-family HTH domain